MSHRYKRKLNREVCQQRIKQQKQATTENSEENLPQTVNIEEFSESECIEDCESESFEEKDQKMSLKRKTWERKLIFWIQKNIHREFLCVIDISVLMCARQKYKLVAHQFIKKLHIKQ